MRLFTREMTIVAQLNTLPDAYKGMEALRQKAIPPALTQRGEFLLIGVDDDFAEAARAIIAAQLSEQCLRKDAADTFFSFEDYNA